MFIDTKEIKIQLDISQLDYDKITDAIIDTIKEKSSDELLDRVFSNLWYKTEEKLYNLIAEHMSDILTKKYGFSIMENAYNGSYNKKLMIYDYEKYRKFVDEKIEDHFKSALKDSGYEEKLNELISKLDLNDIIEELLPIILLDQLKEFLKSEIREIPLDVRENMLEQKILYKIKESIR